MILKTMRAVIAAIFLMVSGQIFAQSIEPPVAKKEKHLTIIHGDTLIDHYHWLRKKRDHEVINYLSAENGYLQRMTKSGEWIREKLFEEMKSRINLNDHTYAVKKDDYYYYFRYVEGKDYGIYCRKKGSMEASEEILLDINKLAEGMGYISVRPAISPDHQWLAYQVDYTGGGKTSVYFKNIATGEIIDDEVHRVGMLTWFNDSQTIAYTKRDTTNRSYIAMTHKIGDDVKKDRTLFEEKDKTFAIGLGKTTSEKYILLTSSVTLTTEIQYMDADNAKADLNIFSPRKSGRRYYINHFEGDDHFYVLKNFPNRNNEIVRTPVNNIAPDQWESFVPANDSVPLNTFSMSPEFLVLVQKINGLDQFKVINRKTGENYLIDFPDPSYAVSGGIDLELGPHILTYSYSSMKNPGGTYKYDLRTRENVLLKREEVSGYDPEQYITKRIFATAEDGTAVPVSVVYNKDIDLNGNNPLLLGGYGSYGTPNYPNFSSVNLNLLERGFIIATAHIRGGGEYGYKWYEEGKLLKKKNTFTDFISVAEHLIDEKYTNKDKLVIHGASAGGLLMGAVVNMRPDLFKAVIMNVPFLDVINTMLDETIPLTTFEYDEWGNPNDEEYYRYMKSYSPYDNIKRQDYPIMLVQGGYNDLNVGYWEPAKFVAKLRATKTDDNRLYLKTAMKGAHGLTSGRYEGMRQLAFEQSFILNAVGVDPGYGTVRGIVTDHDGEPMPFVNVFLQGSTKGTTTNTDGEYALDLKSGQYNLVFSHVAYKNITRKIDLKGDVDLDIQLESDAIMLNDIVVSDKYTDPAFEIMKNAIDKRKHHLKAIDGFSADVYMKSFDRLDEIPDKLPAFLPKEDLPDSSDLGLVYLSESISTLHKKQPDEVKEIMLSSKVGGWSQGYSWNQAGQIDFNFYKNLVEIGDLSARGIVSPVAANAMLFYRFEYLGELQKQGSTVSKIKVIPRRRSDPVFSGNVYIAEDTWNVVGVDMILTNRQIEFYDTLHIEQDYVKIEEGLWMPLLLKSFSKIKIFGFAGSTNNIISYKNYEVNPTFPDKFFNNEVFKIEKESNKKDSTYWLENRPVVLTAEELRYYHKKDSTEQLRQSKDYLDSLDRKRNKFKIGKLLTGYNYRNRYKQTYTKYSGLADIVQFNTVEGLVADFKWNLYKGDWTTFDKKNFALAATARYGFANERLNGTFSFSKRLDPMKFKQFSISGGRDVTQFNSNKPISDLINTSYSLFNRENFMKLYGRDYLSIHYGQELINGLMLKGTVTYEDRMPLVNHSDYAFVSTNEDRRYTSNNPLNPESDEPSFDPHQALTVDLSAKITFKQKFATRPNWKMIYGSKYPTVTLNYKKGIPVAGSEVDFDFASITIGDNLDLGLFGRSSYDVTFGGFIRSANVPFIDYKHFTGNQTIFLNKQEYWGRDRAALNTFHMLDYYGRSTTSNYWEAHYEHHFNGFLINKLPLVRRSKFQTLGGVNFLRTGDLEHVELFFGFENILKVLRVDFVGAYDDVQSFQSGFRLWFGIGNL